jgi:hypothetical protein
MNHIFKRIILAVMIAIIPNCTIFLAWLITFGSFSIMNIFQNLFFQGVVVVFSFLGLVLAITVQDRDLFD